MQALAHVDASYIHRQKQVLPQPVLAVGDSLLKWYDLAPVAQPVDPEIARQARAFVGAEAPRTSLAADHGFVVLHRCGADFYFLLVTVWRGNNELWQAVYYRDAGLTGFAEFAAANPGPGTPLRPTFCVWEIGIAAYEAAAWARFLSSPRDKAGVARWREELFRGAV